jgi:hypothetical protein
MSNVDDTSSSKPSILQVAPENIPDELRQCAQWVLWRNEQRGGKWTKPPLNATSTDAATWIDFEAAVKTYKNGGGADGIGFVFSTQDEYVGIDLDHVFDPSTGKPKRWALEIIQRFQSYTEFSPSRTGVHIIVKGALPNGVTGRKKGNVEIYTSGRYLTVTGQRLKNAPVAVEPRQAEIQWLIDHYFTDQELLDRAFAAKNNDKLHRLFDGDISAYPSQSEADLALCSMLAFWASDVAQLDRLFRRSKLFREKWDERHGDGTYGEITITKAWENCAEHYEQQSSGIHVEPLVDESHEDESQQQPVSFPEVAWKGPFGAWREVVFGSTEAPAEYLWASCLIVIGLIFGRSIRFENPRPLYPNFYVLILGATGDDRKSTALTFAQDALYFLGLGDQVEVLSGIQSSEAIYESLSKVDGARALAYCDELRSLLTVAQRKGQRDIIPRLGSLYYCPKKDSLNRSEDSTVITNPFFSLIAATPAAYVHDLLTHLEIEGGFLNRFLTVTGNVRPWLSRARPPSRWAMFVKSTCAMGQYKAHAFEMTPEADKLWDEFYKDWKSSRQPTAEKPMTERSRKLTARIDEHILKLAMVYSAIEKKAAITTDALVTAISVGQWLQANTLRAYVDVGADQLGQCERAIIETLKHATDRRMWRRELQRLMAGRGFNGEMFGRAIKALETNDEIYIEPIRVASGRKRPVVTLFT